MLKYIYLFILLIYLSISPSPLLAKESGGKTEVKAEIPAKRYIRIFGYTSPYSLVQANGVRVFAQTTSDRSGYFLIDKLPLSLDAEEICLVTLDSQRRTGFPLCLPITTEEVENEYGPLLLSPTFSLSKGFFWQNGKETGKGMTIPNSRVLVSLFEAGNTYISLVTAAQAADRSSVTVTSDAKGAFEIKLPSGRATLYRLFAIAFRQEAPTLKSQTLSYSVASNLDYWLRYILPKLIIFFIIMTAFIFAISKEYRTNCMRRRLLLFNETKLQPFLVRKSLALRRLWYNLRQYLKSGRK